MTTDSNGAQRSDSKPLYRKIPHAALRRLAETLTEGSQKYDKGLYHSNWRQGTPEFAAECFDHAIEHMYSWIEGDDSEDHLAHAMANLAFLIHFEEVGVYEPNKYNYLVENEDLLEGSEEDTYKVAVRRIMEDMNAAERINQEAIDYASDALSNVDKLKEREAASELKFPSWKGLFTKK